MVKSFGLTYLFLLNCCITRPLNCYTTTRLFLIVHRTILELNGFFFSKRRQRLPHLLIKQKRIAQLITENRAKTGTTRAKPHFHRLKHTGQSPPSSTTSRPAARQHSSDSDGELRRTKPGTAGAKEDRRTGYMQPVIVHHRALPPQLRLHNNKQTEAKPWTRRRRADYHNH